MRRTKSVRFYGHSSEATALCIQNYYCRCGRLSQIVFCGLDPATEVSSAAMFISVVRYFRLRVAHIFPECKLDVFKADNSLAV